MDEKKKTDRPRDQWGKSEREEETGSAWKASPGLSTPGTDAPGRVPPPFDYRAEEEEHLGAVTPAEAAPLTASIGERTEGEFTLEGASVGGGPAVPPGGAVSGAYREMGPEGSPREANMNEKPGIGSEEGSGAIAGAKEKLAGAKEKLIEAKDTGMDRLAGAKDTVREKASGMSSKVAQSARGQVDQHKGQVADRLEGLHGPLHEKVHGKAEEFVNEFTTRADDYLSKATHLLREKNSDELMQLARDEFRARPLAITGGFFALGFIGARLLRS
jgi:hypothetical protein